MTSHTDPRTTDTAATPATGDDTAAATGAAANGAPANGTAADGGPVNGTAADGGPVNGTAADGRPGNDAALGNGAAAGDGPATGAGTEGGVPDRSAASLPEPPAPNADVASVDDVEEAMRDVVDPELGINVVDLGLVYDIRVDEQNTAVLDMTLTSAACPLTDVIEDQARSALVGGPAGGIVGDIKINWVWMPPWGPEKITEDGREQLRALGFTV